MPASFRLHRLGLRYGPCLSAFDGQPFSFMLHLRQNSSRVRIALMIHFHTCLLTLFVCFNVCYYAVKLRVCEEEGRKKRSSHPRSVPRETASPSSFFLLSLQKKAEEVRIAIGRTPSFTFNLHITRKTTTFRFVVNIAHHVRLSNFPLFRTPGDSRPDLIVTGTAISDRPLQQKTHREPLLLLLTQETFLYILRHTALCKSPSNKIL